MEYFLADDLSGALDAAAAFHAAGRTVVVPLVPGVWPVPAAGTVVGVTTESRNLPPAAAAAAVAAALAAGQARGARLVYKKIDSTLRGPVAAELAALAAADPRRRILFAPANPAVGRTVVGGVLRVHGVPVAETEFARDPVSPVRTSSLRDLLGAAATPQVHLADAAVPADLAAAVAAMAAQPGPWVAVGSGALARPIAAALPAPPPASAPTPGPLSAGPILWLNGSGHPRSREQAAAWAATAGLSCFAPGESGAAGEGAGSLVVELRTRGAAILQAPAGRGDSGAVLAALVGTAAAAIRAAGVTRLLVTGGETAFALAQALGVERLVYRGEIEPGLALARAESAGAAMDWAVKPGGFGDLRTWPRAADAFRTGLVARG